MHGKKNILMFCISTSLILLMFSVTVASTHYTVGVKVGDWALYDDVYLAFTSNMTGYEQTPPEMNISWFSMKIVNTLNGNVTLLSDTIYKNGTEETSVLCENITSGVGNLSVGIIPSNLGTGDVIPANLTWYIGFSGKPLSLTINGTITRKYAGADREVNYANITVPITSGSATGFMNVVSYWDKKTGVICEEQFTCTMGYTVGSTYYYYNLSTSWKMVATNMWSTVFTVHDGYKFNVTMLSNSTVSNFNFNESLKQISFNVTGPTGKKGYCNITIPKDLLQGPWTIMFNNNNYTSNCRITENTTHTFIYIPYSCSTNAVQIIGTTAIPETTPAMIIPLLMVLSMITLFLIKRRKKQ